MVKKAPIAFAIFLLLAGCSRGNPPAAETPVAAGSPAAAPAPADDASALLAELTQTLRKFSAEQRRVPASLNELVSNGYLKALPAAPSGKTFAIDPKQLTVVLR